MKEMAREVSGALRSLARDRKLDPEKVKDGIRGLGKEIQYLSRLGWEKCRRRGK